MKTLFKIDQIDKKKLLNYIYTLTIAFTGGFAFSLFGLPLPWMLGPMVITVISSMTFKEAYLPLFYKKFGLYILGIAMGLYFTPSIGKLIIGKAEIIITFSIITITLGLINGYIFKLLFKLDSVTAIFGSIPGGMSQMVEIGTELGGRPEIIAIKQTLRVIIVVTIIPGLLMFVPKQSASFSMSSIVANNEFTIFGFILVLFLGAIGVLISAKLNIPVPFLTGPLIVISICGLSGVSLVEIPPFLLHAAQLFIGVSVGSQFKKERLVNYRKYVLLGLFSGISLTILSLMMAFPLMFWTNIDLPTAILSMAPGGLAEMSISAVALGANVPLVAAFQILRMILSIIILPKIIVIFMKKLNKTYKL